MKENCIFNASTGREYGCIKLKGKHPIKSDEMNQSICVYPLQLIIDNSLLMFPVLSKLLCGR